jgi:hypothetical protein
MPPSWTQRADNVLALFDTMMSGKQLVKGTPEHAFYDALWHFCQQVKEIDSGDGQFVPDNPFSG